MDINLTKDADRAICSIYKVYLDCRKSGESRKSSKEFLRPEKCLEVFPDMTRADKAEILKELENAGLIHVFMNLTFVLEDSAIIYMENRFPHGVSDVLEWIAKIKGVIPFV